MSDEFADRMREFGERLGWNRAERRAHGLTKAKARKQGWIPNNVAGSGETPDERDPESARPPTKQVQIKKPKKGRPNS